VSGGGGAQLLRAKRGWRMVAPPSGRCLLLWLCPLSFSTRPFSYPKPIVLLFFFVAVIPAITLECSPPNLLSRGFNSNPLFFLFVKMKSAQRNTGFAVLHDVRLHGLLAAQCGGDFFFAAH
jgi:hypothetical protein